MKNTPSIIFNTEVNQFCRKYLVKGNRVSKEDLQLFTTRSEEMLSSLFEQLLLFDKISFKVYGENIPLAILINTLGINSLEQLIEETAIEFVLWTPLVTYNEDEFPELMPLQSGNLSSPAHSNPDESIKRGFDWLKNQPDRKIRRELQRKLRKIYKIPDKYFSRNAASIVMDAYKSNKLLSYGMPNDVDISKLNKDRRAQLCGYATEVLETTILSQYGYSSFEKYENYSLSKESFDRIQRAFKIQENIGKIFELENIPNLKSLYFDKKIDLKTIMKLRNKPDVIKFRKWLYSISEKVDAKKIAEVYIDSLVESKGFFDTRKGKFIKTVSLFTLGAGIGTLIAGIPGTILGGPIAKIIEPAADLGLDLIDTYYLDGLLRGWNPRLFIDRLKNNS